MTERGIEPGLAPDSPRLRLEVRELCKRFRGTPALDHLNLTLAPGRIMGLLGPNGSGKTTLIKLACGLIKPDSGEILINGNAPGIVTKAQVAYLPDVSYLNDWMRVEDIIAMFADFYQDFDRDKALSLVADLNLPRQARLKTLSKGNREKVQLLLVMSRNASLYLLDEPIGGVDPAAREYILNTIITNYTENASMLISTHLLGEVETVLDDAVFLRAGQVAVSGSVDTLREESGKSLDALFREVFRC